MLRLHTFGGCLLTRDGARVDALSGQRRALALLAVLGAAGERGVSRDTLVGQLWPESDDEHARTSLKQLVRSVRSRLDTPELLLGSAELRLNPDLVTADVAEFRAALTRGDQEAAAALYAGAFLDGFFLRGADPFERWVAAERAALAQDFARVLEALAERASANGDVRAAVESWRRLASADPLNARAVLGLMRALDVAGERAAALQHARVYEQLVREELDAAPEPAVTALVERLRRTESKVWTNVVDTGPGQAGPATAEPVFDVAAIQGGARSVERGLSRRKRWLATAGGIGVLVLTAAAYGWLSPGRSLLDRGVIAERDLVVVADFDVGGPDSTLGSVLANALRRYLGESSVVAVMPRGSVESALVRMRRPPGTRLRPEVAREVAQREGARAVVEGDLAQLGAGYLVTLRLVDAATGDELASFPATAARLEADLIPALDKVGRALRREVGESLRDLDAAPSLRKLTTPSLEALRLLETLRVTNLPGGRLLPIGEQLARLREVLALDSTFAYAWLVMGNSLSNDRYRTAAQDSAFMRMYGLRDRLTRFEHTQTTAFYWWHVGLDRRRAIDVFEASIARDSLEFRTLLNLATTLVEAREFERAETLLRRHERAVDTSRAMQHLVDARIGQRRIAGADSLVMSQLVRRPNDAGLLRARVRIALAALRLDTAAAVADRALGARNESRGAMLAALAGIARARGQLTEAHRLDAKADSGYAAFLRATRFDPVLDRPVSLAAEELWLRGNPSQAIARLDEVFTAHPVSTLRQIQDRMDAVRAAALYAAAGRPDRARPIIDAISATSDSIALRAIHSLRHTALGEIALAENRPREAMAMFRESDRAADGLPASRCAVCILPALARAAERAGWADSARSYWERYVTTPSLDRLATDQWFLAMGYRRLDALYAEAGDRAKADAYRAKLTELRRSSDADLQRYTSMPRRSTLDGSVTSVSSTKAAEVVRP
jgi:DNA-binding SARP family transcriptional activator